MIKRKATANLSILSDNSLARRRGRPRKLVSEPQSSEVEITLSIQREKVDLIQVVLKGKDNKNLATYLGEKVDELFNKIKNQLESVSV